MWNTKQSKIKQTDDENMTILGKNVTFKGVVYFEGTLQLDSHFEGEIHSTGILVVGEHAVVQGDLSVGTLISSGKIQGTITASDKVQLLHTAVQIGNVQAPTFSIEAGAYFKGYADRGPVPPADDTSQPLKQLPDQAMQQHAQSHRHSEQESGYEQLSPNLAT